MNAIKHTALLSILAAGCGAHVSSTAPAGRAPEVSSWSSGTGATAPWAHDPIRIDFTKAVDADTIDDSSVELVDGSGKAVPKTLALSQSNTRLLVTPAPVGIASSSLEIRLHDSIRGLVGDPLVVPPQPIVVALAPWNALPSLPPAADAQATRLDPDGNPVVAWFEHSTGESSAPIFAARWTPAGWLGFGGSPLVSPQTGKFTDALVMVLDAQGRPTIAWQDQDLTIHVTRFRDGSWHSLGTVEGTGSQPLDLDLALDSNGDPIVAFDEIFGANNQDRVEVYAWAGIGWQPLGDPMNVTGSLDTLNATLGFDGSGAPVIAWYEDVDGPEYAGPLTIVQRWNGIGWNFAGDLMRGQFRGLGAGPDGRLRTVLASETLASGTAQLEVFDGQAWKADGSPTTLPAQTFQLQATVTSDPPSLGAIEILQGATIETTTTQIHVAQLRSGSWTPLTAPPAGPYYERLSSVLAESWGAPVVTGVGVVRFNQ